MACARSHRPLGTDDRAARWEATSRRRRQPGRRDPLHFAPLGGESGLAVTARALPVLVEIVRTHRDQKVIIVSHKATISPAA
mgnify:CR=1 FL=1